jgi:hypothetical protein
MTAITTLGTANNNSIADAIAFEPGYGSGMSAADIATMSNLIKNDLVNTNPVIPESFSSNGLLYVPNRGILKMLPGDVVGIDPTGWPILISKNSINAGGTIWVT